MFAEAVEVGRADRFQIDRFLWGMAAIFGIRGFAWTTSSVGFLKALKFADSLERQDFSQKSFAKRLEKSLMKHHVEFYDSIALIDYLT